MALKKVVLPAPLGPMMLTIRPRSMFTVILLTAVRPPKRFTTFCVVRMYLLSATGLSFLVAFLVFPFGQLALAAGCRDEAGRLVDHHDDQEDAEDQSLVLGRIELVRKVLPVEAQEGGIALPKLGEIEGETLQHLDVQQGDEGGAHDHARNAAEAAQDDHGEHAHRLQEGEGLRT